MQIYEAPTGHLLNWKIYWSVAFFAYFIHSLDYSAIVVSKYLI